MWEVQRKLPAITLFANVVFTPNDFLARKLPAVSQFVDKKSVDFAQARRDYLARLDATIIRWAGDADAPSLDPRDTGTDWSSSDTE